MMLSKPDGSRLPVDYLRLVEVGGTYPAGLPGFAISDDELYRPVAGGAGPSEAHDITAAPEWQGDAACLLHGIGAATSRMVREGAAAPFLLAECVDTTACLEQALLTDERFGIWGAD